MAERLEALGEVRRLAEGAIDSALAYYSGDLAIDAETFYCRVIDLLDEVEHQRAEAIRQLDLWQYVEGHPEDALKAAAEAMGFVTYGRDSYGHMTEPLEPEGATDA